MATYHARVASGSRLKGQSAAVKVAYVLREGAYGGRDDLVDWGSGNMPIWAVEDPRMLFEAADAYERLNGRLYIHVWVALPNELDKTERHDLALAIGASLTASGLPYVYAVHAGEPKSLGEPANPHVHFVISERMNDGIERDAELWFRRANRRNPAAGGAAKDRSLKEVTWVEDTRKVIEQLINEHLVLAGREEERVTADSHATRIVEAEAWGDTETADRLRLHPPGIHLGPAAAAMERDRFRETQRGGEEPELARPGEPTERGDLARARAAEEELARGELARVSEQLRCAREGDRLATESVAAARAAGLTGDEIVCEYEDAESVAEGSGWLAVAEVATAQAERKEQAEAAAGSLGIDVAAVYRDAEARGENGVAGLKVVIGIVEEARTALLSDSEIRAIHAAGESGERGSGWTAVIKAAEAGRNRRTRAEVAAQEAGIGDVDAVYTAARSRSQDPLAALEEATAARQQEWKEKKAARERVERAAVELQQLEEMRARTGVARLAQRNLNSVTAVPEKSPPLPKPDDRRVPDATWDDAEPLVRALTDLEEETGPSRLAQRNLNSVTAVPEKSPLLPKPDDRRVPDATWDDAEPLVRALTDLEEETGPSRLAQRNLNSVTAVPEKSPLLLRTI